MVRNIKPFYGICKETTLVTMWPFNDHLDVINTGSLVKVFFEAGSYFAFKKVIECNELHNAVVELQIYRCKKSKIFAIPKDIEPFILDIKKCKTPQFLQSNDLCNFLLSVKIGDLISTEKNGIGIVKFIKNCPEYGKGIYFGVEFMTKIKELKDENETNAIKKYFEFPPCSEILSADQILPLPDNTEESEYHKYFQKRRKIFEGRLAKNCISNISFESNIDNKEYNTNQESFKPMNYSFRSNENRNSNDQQRFGINKTKSMPVEGELIKIVDEPANIFKEQEIQKEFNEEYQHDIKVSESSLKSDINFKSPLNPCAPDFYPSENGKSKNNTVNESSNSFKDKENHYNLYEDNISLKNQTNRNDSSVNTVSSKDLILNEQRKAILQHGLKHGYDTRSQKKISIQNETDIKQNYENKGAIPKHSKSKFYQDQNTSDSKEKMENTENEETSSNMNTELPVEYNNDFESDDLSEFIVKCNKNGCNGSGFIELNDNSSLFKCPICFSYNCRVCQVIHTGFSCDEYKNGGKKLPEKRNTKSSACNYCEGKNNKNRKKCVECNGLNSNGLVETKYDRKECLAGEWICNVCNFKNIIHTFLCENCEASSKNTIKCNEKPQVPKWYCEKCNVLNITDSSFCVHSGKEDEKRNRIGKMQNEYDIASNEKQQNAELEQHNKMDTKPDIADTNNEIVEWKCEHCNEVNISDCIICKNCSKTDNKLFNIKKHKDSKFGSYSKNNINKSSHKNSDPTKIWTCVFCSFDNTQESKECVKCRKKHNPSKKFSFNCKSPGCVGFWAHDGNASKLKCPLCAAKNCLDCDVVHANMNCIEYKQRMSIKRTDSTDVLCPTCNDYLRFDKKTDSLICFHCEKKPRRGILHSVYCSAKKFLE